MRRLATPRLALVAGAAQLALLVALVPTAALDHQASPQLLVTAGVIGLAFAGVGALVAFRRPELSMGWIMLGCGALQALSELGVAYSVLDYRRDHGQLPLGPVALLIEPLWLPGFVVLVFAIVLYPHGTLPSPRWRWPLRALGALTGAVCAAAWSLILTTAIDGRVRVEAGGDLYQLDHPPPGWAFVVVLEGLGIALVAVVVGGWLVSQIVGYRRLEGDARAQQKWIISGATISLLAVVTNVLPYPFSSATNQLTVSDFVSWALAALPVAMGVGILRYRLYEIDRIVSRTVAYLLLTGLLVGTFIGLVALTTDVLPFSSSVGVAASTLAAAALFNPLRRRVQRTVDRRFNRARYDADATVNAFAARLRDAVDLDAVQADLLATVQRAVEPAHASVWIRGASK